MDLRNLRKCNWIKKLLVQGKTPIIDILEEVSIDSWKESEIYWIAQFRAWGFTLSDIIQTYTTKKGISSLTIENVFSMEWYDEEKKK